MWREDWEGFAQAWAQGVFGGKPEDSRAIVKVRGVA
jgi:hypothetical protein